METLFIMLQRCMLLVFLAVVFNVKRDFPVDGKRGMRRDPEEDAELTGEAPFSHVRGEGSPERGDYDAVDKAVLRELFGKPRQAGFSREKSTCDYKVYKTIVPNFGYPFMYWADWRDLAMQYDEDYPEEEGGEERETQTTPNAQEMVKADRKTAHATAEPSSISSAILWWLLFMVSLVLLSILIAWIICILCCKELLEEYQNPPPECQCGETKILINKGTSTDQDKLKESSQRVANKD